MLSWQLINSSYAPENKPFVPINTAKCETEDVVWELSTLATITIGHGLAETRWPMLTAQMPPGSDNLNPFLYTKKPAYRGSKAG